MTGHGSGIIGNYLVERELGRGGMGVVYAAKHRVLGRPAAIKLLLANEPDRVERFFNEARAAMAIEHPGIVKIYDVGIAADGRAFLAMELLAGQTLHARLADGPLPLRIAVELARQIAGALAAAHAAGVIHRDLKPDNIFLEGGSNQVKLVDFGIAKLANPLNVRTATGALIGTPAYMSPEQCEGLRELDARSDLYSLGCVMFAMLVGHPPFEAGGTAGIIASQLGTPPPPLASVCPGASGALADVVARLLAKSRDARFPDARAVLAALANPAVDVIAGTGDAALTADAPLSHQVAALARGPTASLHAPSMHAPSMHAPTPAPSVHAVPTPALPPHASSHAASPPPAPPTGGRPSLAPGTAPPADVHPSLAPAEPPRRTRLGWIAALVATAGIAAVIAVLATRSCGATTPPVVADAAVAADALPPSPPEDAPSRVVDLRSLIDAAMGAPPADAARVAIRDKDQPRPKDPSSDPPREPSRDPSRQPVGDPPDAPPEDPPTLAPPKDPPADAAPEPPKPVPPPSIDVRIEFADGSFSMPGGHDGELDRIAQIAAAHPELRFVLAGDAAEDESRTADSLALARANAVMMRLIGRRISRDRFTLAGRATGGRAVRITTR